MNFDKDTMLTFRCTDQTEIRPYMFCKIEGTSKLGSKIRIYHKNIDNLSKYTQYSHPRLNCPSKYTRIVFKKLDDYIFKWDGQIYRFVEVYDPKKQYICPKSIYT